MKHLAMEDDNTQRLGEAAVAEGSCAGAGSLNVAVDSNVGKLPPQLLMIVAFFSFGSVRFACSQVAAVFDLCSKQRYLIVLLNCFLTAPCSLLLCL